ncbi:HFL314Wp [Eremothecium sinecaudum]|uniref:HFL314Wp n=1 Tax=Eremothecium sinecaudum TaxID=45286 RepID=A0A120K2H6_9SACH|nr:HFL314Wp [Eremothecium sinecaudum]AMD21542.1 HFL314Wp [Eremothecium sinecaudum]
MSSTQEVTEPLKIDEPKTKKLFPSSALYENAKSLAAGGVGGVCAVLTGQPFDLLKVRCQSNQASGTLDAIRIILAESRALPGNTAINAVRGFYKGVIPPLLGVTPIFAISFWGYDMGKRIVAPFGASATLSTAQMATAGFISAIPTTLVMAPMERVKVVLQTGSAGSMGAAARKILATGGISSLFKGSLATLARDGPGSAIYFASYEVTKAWLNGGKDANELSISSVCLAGGVAGMSMWIAVFPIDTIKTTLQSSHVRQGMLEATKQIYSTRGGVRGFFPGLGPALMRAFPANAATFLGVEMTRSLFLKYGI